MSYLEVPRIVFFGRFRTDPSTVNNDPEHFDTDAFQPNYWRDGGLDAVNGWWNPGGSNSWSFAETTVTSTTYSDGSVATDPAFDPLIGIDVSHADDRVPGKIVDLDPEQQAVPALWGVVLRIGDPRDGLGVGGQLATSSCADLWPRVPGGRPDSMFSAVYQTVIEDPDWGPSGGSRALDELRAAVDSSGDRALSVRLVVDAFDDKNSSSTFTFGRMSGVIGVTSPSEPRRFVAARRMEARAAVPPLPSFNGGPLAVTPSVGGERASLVIDLGNSLSASSPGGPPVDVGALEVALVPAGQPPVPLASVDYQNPRWYETTSGLVTAPLTPEHAKLAASTPVGLVASGNVVAAEAADGTWVRADQNAFRVDPGGSVHVELWARRFGAPLAAQPLSFALDPTTIQAQVVAGPIPGPAVGVPDHVVTFPSTVTTDEDGQATVAVSAADPGNPRGYIDGQVYVVAYQAGEPPPAPGSTMNSAELINLRVFSGFDAPDEPTWLRDIEPIFTQYAYLYPVMKPIVDLADYASVVRSRPLLVEAFSRPISDPGYMPVTRDLSGTKLEMIQRWLTTCRYASFDTADDLALALQRAVELEHSTIPPYLTALYSLKPGTNTMVADLLGSVVIEEMLHLTLVANLLASIGRGANLGQPGFVPIYPGPLPGGLVAGLTVRVRRCSIAQVRDVFMAIERGEHVVETVRGGARRGDPVDVSRFTIGWFYEQLEQGLVSLHKAGGVTFGHPERQVTRWPVPGGLEPIVDLDGALAALATIRRQGEGAGPLQPGEGGTHAELGHYYRFAEIVEGRRLVPDEDGQGFSYTGDRIPFDESAVWPSIDDPDAAMLEPDSQAALLSNQFRDTYRALLRALHTAFNGDPDHITFAMSLMYSLDLQARQLMATPIGDGPTTAGPCF